MLMMASRDDACGGPRTIGGSWCPSMWNGLSVEGGVNARALGES